MTRSEIVIVGGGYVGFHAYRTLMKTIGARVKSGAIRITLVDPETSHTFHGWSGETVAGAISDSARRSPFRRIFRHARVIRGFAGRIDAASGTLEVRSIDGREAGTLRFDHLVLGIGVGDDQDLIPGTREFGFGLRGGAGPEGLRRLILERIEEAELERNPERRARLLSFVVAGGGFTGVETAAAIQEYLNVLRPDYRRLVEHEDSVTLVHAGETLLEEISEQKRLVRYASKALVRAGVRVRLGMRATRIEADGLRLADGSSIPGLNVITTVGGRVREIPGGEEWNRDARGRIVTDRFLRVEGTTNIWAGGDGAHVRRVSDRTASPSNAMWAIRHGGQIGKNISALLTRRELHPFTWCGLGQAASLGIGKGVVELKGWQFTGWTGWIMRLLFFLYFVPSRRTGLQGLVEWLALPFAGRERTQGGPVRVGFPQGIDDRSPAFRSGEIPGRMN